MFCFEPAIPEGVTTICELISEELALLHFHMERKGFFFGKLDPVPEGNSRCSASFAAPWSGMKIQLTTQSYGRRERQRGLRRFGEPCG